MGAIEVDGNPWVAAAVKRKFFNKRPLEMAENKGVSLGYPHVAPINRVLTRINGRKYNLLKSVTGGYFIPKDGGIIGAFNLQLVVGPTLHLCFAAAKNFVEVEDRRWEAE